MDFERGAREPHDNDEAAIRNGPRKGGVSGSLLKGCPAYSDGPGRRLRSPLSAGRP